MTIMQNPPSMVRTVYQFECHICKSVLEQNWFGATPPHPGHPGPGWQQIGMEVGPSLWICPDHKVVIIVDGVDFNKLNGTTQGEVTCNMCAALCRPCSAHADAEDKP